jgi:CubicO group peptidase (beta-lactamase class C family)
MNAGLYPIRIALLLLLLGKSCTVSAEQNVPMVLDDFFGRHMDRIAAPGFAAVVVDSNGVLFSKGYGVVTAGGSLPVTDDTIMAIGSLTKSFTALAILQLEERGLLALDDPVTRYLPWFRSADKSQSDAITLRMCLHNTTGLSPSFQSLTSNQSRRPDALESGVRALSSYRMTRAPGESFEYLNEGWNVLGLIVESVTGLPFEQYLAREIFQPLQMHQTSALRSELETWPIATGHFAGVEPVPAGFIHIQGSLPAGSGLYSSAANLGNYLMALLNEGSFGGETIISQDSIAKMWAPGAPMMVLPVEMGGTGEPASYGMGWIVLTIDGHKYIGHGGEFRTMSSMVLLDPERGVAVALLYNTGELNAYTSETAHYAAVNALRLASGLPLSDYGIPRGADPTLNEFQPEASSTERYQGTYLSDSGKKLRITAGGSEGLQAYLTESIYPADFDVDFINTTNVVLRNISSNQPASFDIDAAGNVVAANLHGEIFRRQKLRLDDGFRAYRSGTSPYFFELPENWKVTIHDGGFSAYAGNNDESSISGTTTEHEFEDWLQLLRQDYPDSDISVSSDLRNGRFCQSATYSHERKGEAHQLISFHCRDGLSTFVTTAEVPFGELTRLVIETLNRYLDSMEF